MNESVKAAALRLGSGTDTRDGETDVDGRADTTEEELSFQEDLTVGDGNDLKKGDETPTSKNKMRQRLTLVGM